MDLLTNITSLPNTFTPQARTKLQLILTIVAAYALWNASRRVWNTVSARSLIRNLPTLEKGSWLAGNLPELFDAGNIRWHHGVVKKYGGAVQFQALLGDEQIYVTDPRALHYILVKEQNIFEEPSHLISTNQIILGEGLLSTIGEQHRKQRRILNPVFHIKHMRRLIPTFCAVTKKVITVLERKVSCDTSTNASAAPTPIPIPNPARINMFEWLSRTALELVGQGGMGYSFDSLADGEVCAYTATVKDLIPAVTRIHIPLLLLPGIRKYVPPALGRFVVEYAPFGVVRTLRRITDLLDSTSRGVLERKRREIEGWGEGVREEEEEGREGRDILTVLLRANERAEAKDRLSDEEVIGSMTTLIFAAQDTTASALSRILHTLAIHTDAQERLRAEVRAARSAKAGDEDEAWDYDELEGLKYLDAVCRESLRLYAPVSWLWRVARQPTTLPLLRPITGTDGQLISSIPIAKGQGVIVGIAASNRDEATWGGDAASWKPERWLGAGNKAKGEEAMGDVEDGGGDRDVRESEGMKEAKLPGVYSGMMTFSGGGRACIGFKFSLLEMKVVLAMLIEKFRFTLPDEEIVWRMTNIQTPALKGKENETPQLPLKVSLA